MHNEVDENDNDDEHAEGDEDDDEHGHEDDNDDDQVNSYENIVKRFEAVRSAAEESSIYIYVKQ